MLKYERHWGIYHVWANIRDRCYNPRNKKYPLYGGRGIGMAEEWRKDPKAFQDWALANGYKHGLCIGRIDTNKGYTPDNTIWTTYQANNKNRRAWSRTT